MRLIEVEEVDQQKDERHHHSHTVEDQQERLAEEDALEGPGPENRGNQRDDHQADDLCGGKWGIDFDE